MNAEASTAAPRGKQLYMKFSPPLSAEMRAHLASLRDEAYADGKHDGRREVEREYYGNGVISMGIGALCGYGLHFLIERLFA